MKVEKISNETNSMVINLLKNVKGLSIESKIVENCHVLLNEKNDIVGTISFEKFNNYAIIRYFVFKRNIDYNDLKILYNDLENELRNLNIIQAIAIINSEEVKDVFELLDFKKIDKEKVFFDETIFTKTSYKDNDIYIKKIN